MPRLRARVDTNQREIVEALRDAGCSVQPIHTLGKGIPDLLISTPTRETLLIECKTAKGKFTPDQVEWFSRWRGRIEVIRDPAEIGRLFGAMREEVG
ncbi:MAG: hypothetical protein OHK0012_04930 [Synechococcales cyanobacterium]